MQTWRGNKFEMKKEGASQVWYWEDTHDSQCGNSRRWRYVVQEGDLVNREAGKCPNGSVWSEMQIFGKPEKVRG